MKLSQLKAGETAVLEKIEDNLSKLRLLALGFVAGTKIKLLKASGRRQTFLVGLRGCAVAIKLSAAESILVKKEEAVQNA